MTARPSECYRPSSPALRSWAKSTSRKNADPGRPNQDHGRRQTARPASEHHSDQPRPVGRYAYPGPDNIKVGVRQLGLAERDFKNFNSLIKRPNGIILVTGPTGSGKTTTLYASMNALNRPDRKIITAEDPVEYYLAGINQVEVKHNIGLDFARIIRAMLRQAPNVILVGEMRDQETAQMGIQASLTGHLVFSTLHTNDAPSAVSRMVDMGVPSYMVASSVIAILAQRLVRTICPAVR